MNQEMKNTSEVSLFSWFLYFLIIIGIMYIPLTYFWKNKQRYTTMIMNAFHLNNHINRSEAATAASCYIHKETESDSTADDEGSTLLNGLNNNDDSGGGSGVTRRNYLSFVSKFRRIGK